MLYSSFVHVTSAIISKKYNHSVEGRSVWDKMNLGRNEQGRNEQGQNVWDEMIEGQNELGTK